MGIRSDCDGERVAYRSAAENVCEFLELERLHSVHHLLHDARDEQQNTASECVYGEYDGFYGDFADTLPCRLVDSNAVRVVALKLSKLRRA